MVQLLFMTFGDLFFASGLEQVLFPPLRTHKRFNFLQFQKNSKFQKDT